MKIIDFRQENICWMCRDDRIMIDRSDLWGDPEKNTQSLLVYGRDFAEADADDRTAHVIYLYGQGGVGKSFVCREVCERLSDDAVCRDKLYVLSVDLQKQAGYEDNLKCLADGIAMQTGKKDIFPRFHMAYYNYKLKMGEEAEEVEHSTKWDELHQNSTFSLAAGAAGFLSAFGAVSDVIDLANEGYKWFLKIRENGQYKALARQMEAMEPKQLKGQLVRYFAVDFCEFIKTKNIKKRRFVFLLDTVESMRYQTLRRGEEEDYLEWLAGSSGLFRLMPESLWILFGREEIPWKNYDSKWEESFVSREFPKPDDEMVREYLLKQLGQGFLEEKYDAGFRELADEMIRRTEGYSLAVENCVDVYFRIWNENLRKNRVTEHNAANAYRPTLEEMREMLFEGKGKKLISNRFLQYYTLQEKEVMYTLVCLGTWTDEILEKLIWKGSVSNSLIYGEMCATSFVSVENGDQKSIQGLMLDIIMEECPHRLKGQLFHCILEQMKSRELDGTYWLLCQSAIHIRGFYRWTEEEKLLMAEEFVRAADCLRECARFTWLSQLCDRLLEAEGWDKDEDFCNAVLTGKFFAKIFLKEDGLEEICLLRAREQFSRYSLRIGAAMLKTAEKVHAWEQGYEIAALLSDKATERMGDGCYCQIYERKVNLMQKLGERFENALIEEEIQKLCELTRRTFSERPELAVKLNAEIWARYYLAREDIPREFAVQKLSEGISEYRSLYTEDLDWDVNLCVLEVEEERARQVIDLGEVNRKALRGLRILDQIYGEEAVRQSDTEFLMGSLIAEAGMPKRDAVLFRKLFQVYYKQFYASGNWDVYPLVRRHSLPVGFGYGAKDWEDNLEYPEVGDMIERGILYLSNLSVTGLQEQLRLLLCTDLLNRSKGIWSYVNQEESSPEKLWKNILNNRLLTGLLHRAVESVCREGGDAERDSLHTFLKILFKQGSFDSLPDDEKRNLLGLLKLCGMRIERAAWESEYTDSAKGNEFDILGVFRGWEWKFDSQADSWMADTVLYTARRLGKEDGQLEGDILKQLRGLFPEAFKGMGEQDLSKSVGERIAGCVAGQTEEEQQEALCCEFETQIKERLATGDYDAARNIVRCQQEKREERWKQGRQEISEEDIISFFYVPLIQNHGTDGFLESLKALPFVKDKYSALRAYAYMGDKEDFAVFYRDNRQDIWQDFGTYSSWHLIEGEYISLASFIHSMGDEELLRDYFMGVVETAVRKSVYIRKILYFLEWITKCIPFREIWREEICIREIPSNNYPRIYKSIKDFLTEEELLRVFVRAVDRYSETQISFFEGEYFQWLKKVFGARAEERLKDEFPELCAAREKYERNLKDGYLWQIRKDTNEIIDLLEGL